MMSTLDKAKILYENCKSLSSYKEDFLIDISNSDEAYQIQEILSK